MYLCFQRLLHFKAILMFPGIIDAHFKKKKKGTKGTTLFKKVMIKMS